MRGCITKKGSTYSVVVDTGRDENGKRKQKWFNGYKSSKEAEKALIKILNQLEDNSYLDVEKMTVREYLKNWLETYVDVNLSKTTARGYRVNIEKHIIPSLGNIPLHKLQPIHIQDLYNKKVKNGRCDGKGGLSAKSVIYIHRVLRKALSQAVKLQILSKNAADFVDTPKKKTYQAKILNEDEIQLLLNAFRGTNIFIPVVLAISTGLRRGESLGLRWGDIDFEQKTLTISQTILPTNEGYTFDTPKSEKSHRTIVVADNITKLLQHHKRLQENNKKLLGKAYNDFDLVSCYPDGKPFSPSSLSHMFARVLKRNNLPSIRFHDLRHINATLMLKNNIPAKIASERLGHSTVGITLDLYSHVLKEMQEDAALKLDSIIFKPESEHDNEKNT